MGENLRPAEVVRRWVMSPAEQHTCVLQELPSGDAAVAFASDARRWASLLAWLNRQIITWTRIAGQPTLLDQCIDVRKLLVVEKAVLMCDYLSGVLVSYPQFQHQAKLVRDNGMILAKCANETFDVRAARRDHLEPRELDN